ncbi:unnamed protein product [Linum tenue]|uniref:NADP-dependent oxidoreductase domain-containing protein n=1 Tax=Linum tenue TaxID=586396 RepID=A0AAV0IJE7_9ROSI|nr:unnamed protein product [Linum tenue]
MSMSPEPEMIALIRHAVNSGVTFLDTSDVYGPHRNEILLGKAFKGGFRERVELGTKFGRLFLDGKMAIRGDPAYMGELKELVEEGKIKYIGLSEASASTIRRAHAVHPITAVQLEWSLWCRDVEEEIVPTCRELGIGIVAYSPLGRGFLSSGPKVAEKFVQQYGSTSRGFIPRIWSTTKPYSRGWTKSRGGKDALLRSWHSLGCIAREMMCVRSQERPRSRTSIRTLELCLWS